MRGSVMAAVVVGLGLSVAAGVLSAKGPGRQIVSVYAASSLTDAYRELEVRFEAAFPDADVRLTFAGSQVLRLQIEHGAKADVVATANREHIEALQAQGLVGRVDALASTELVIITPPDDPSDVETWTDLARATRLVIGTDHVPVGRYTRTMLDRATARLGPRFAASVAGAVASRESNVRLVRAKVELGEADAAIVYRTDAQASDRVRIVPIPAEVNVAVEVLHGRVSTGPAPVLAEAWLSYLASSAGGEVLTRHGFVVSR